MSGRSLATAVVVALLAAAALSVPAAAATRTWYVAPTGSGGGSCAHPDKHTIQGAISAAHAGDTILVCDGNYTETVLIKGAGKSHLTVKAVNVGKARLRAPASGPSEGFTLVSVDSADNTTFSGFTLIARGAAPCAPVVAMIQITGTSTDTTIDHNRLIVAGRSAYQDPCGYGFGIFQDGNTDTALIDSNEIDDFGDTGIDASGASPTITNNVLNFTHADQGLAYAAAAIHSNGSDSLVVENNDIESPATAGTSTPATDGIFIDYTTGGLVANNTVRHASRGIIAGSLSGLRIRGNTVRKSLNDGIWVDASKAVTVRNNSSLGNGGFDCHQTDSTGPNTWTGNTGLTSKPAGLCAAP
jgi:parallel beta-helix repeat protein